MLIPFHLILTVKVSSVLRLYIFIYFYSSIYVSRGHKNNLECNMRSHYSYTIFQVEVVRLGGYNGKKVGG